MNSNWRDISPLTEIEPVHFLSVFSLAQCNTLYCTREIWNRWFRSNITTVEVESWKWFSASVKKTRCCVFSQMGLICTLWVRKYLWWHNYSITFHVSKCTKDVSYTCHVVISAGQLLLYSTNMTSRLFGCHLVYYHCGLAEINRRWE